jgi:hypothetical protein
MLRDVVCRLDGFGTWPCDEINYIWRYGNSDSETDVFAPVQATPPVKHYISGRFERLARSRNLDVVVEKTCANSLRLPFVASVLPEARYVWIHRDPVDCVGSAIKRWEAPMDWQYTLRKARFVPLTDLHFYGWRFMRNQVQRLLSGEGRVAAWGPVYEGMAQDLAEGTVLDVCAIQWKECIEKTTAALCEMAPEKWMAVSYENFVREPVRHLSEICKFLGLLDVADGVGVAVAGVSAASIGAGRAELGAEGARHIDDLVAPAVAALESLTGSRKA